MGNVTPGYTACEFFKTDKDYKRQLNNARRGVYLASFKPDYKLFFSRSSDIFALGVVLLQDLKLESTSPLYSLARAMCRSDRARRPLPESINQVLDSSADIGAISIGNAESGCFSVHDKV
jgi:hypothetical protein